jgi:hypothetical protein
MRLKLQYGEKFDSIELPEKAARVCGLYGEFST